MSTNSELKIAICDDIEKDRIQIANMAEDILQDMQVSSSIVGYEDASSLLADIQNGSEFQILLLDVMMDEMDGMELAAELRKRGNNTNIIFISINREMALYGYEVFAVRYLAKPLEKNKLKEALMYCCETWQEKREILLPTVKGQYRTSFSDIQFVEAFDRGTRFYLDGETIECRMKFSEVEAWLPKSTFLLCHRAFMVNLSWVKLIRNYEFILTNEKIVPIGKNRYSQIYKSFVDYITN